MECIICDKYANAIGSHIIPASLIKNCIGKHYSEESYEIDFSMGKVDIYFGRDNLKNTNPEIKKHHYKENNILCQKCETKLGILEGEISTEFLEKYKIDKFKSNFTSYYSEHNFEITEPKKISNLKINGYIYSIILRYCKDIQNKTGLKILNDIELNNVKNFVNNFLYNNENIPLDSISKNNLILTFNKYSVNESIIFSFEEIKNPYIFYFCEVIVQLFTTDIPKNVKNLYNDCFNNINDQTAKLIVGPKEFFNELILQPQIILPKELITNGINHICNLNNKTYLENLDELNQLINQNEVNCYKKTPFEILENLKIKYGG